MRSSPPTHHIQPPRDAHANPKPHPAVAPALYGCARCARFGHSAAYFEQRLVVFGGQDFKGPLNDVYTLALDAETPGWHRPEPAGMAPDSNHRRKVLNQHHPTPSPGESCLRRTYDASCM